MPRVVRGGLIQATLCEPTTSPVEKIKRAMIDKHVALIAEAADNGTEVACLQELFYGPYFAAGASGWSTRQASDYFCDSSYDPPINAATTGDCHRATE